ncbi:MAG: ABC transporter permease [Fimbriimonadaceae bacterium]|nr:ABC transporter permease [Fimbriimonadaceae bacterium]
MRRILQTHEAALAVLLIVGLAVAGTMDPTFVSLRAQTLLSTHVWELAIVAVPTMLIIVSGGIDLSVGSIVALAAVAFGLLVEAGWAVPWAAAVALVVGAACGSVNGWLVARLRVHPLIVTLATMAVFRGVAEGVSLARPLSGYSEGFRQLSEGRLGGMPLPGVVFLIVVLAAGIAMRKTTVGRQIVAIGLNEVAARYSGLRVARVKMLLYAGSGLACAVAALLLVARNNTAKADLGTGLELEAITCAVLGGTRIEGGTGNVFGLLLGIVLIHETREFVSWHWKQSELNLIVIGVLLLASVLAQRALAGRTASEGTS